MSVKLPPYDTKTVREWVAFQRQFDTLWQTATNGAVEISLRTTGIAEGATYYYGFDVPVGRMFVLYSRSLTLTEGRYHIDVVTAENGFTGGTLALKNNLRSGSDMTVQTDLYGGVTPSGALTVRTNALSDNGVGQGSSISSGGTASEGVIKMFTGASMLRVDQVIGSGPWDTNIDLIAWEIDDE